MVKPAAARTKSVRALLGGSAGALHDVTQVPIGTVARMPPRGWGATSTSASRAAPLASELGVPGSAAASARTNSTIPQSISSSGLASPSCSPRLRKC